MPGLRFRIVTDKTEKDSVFAAINWAAALKDWDGPEEGERPSAYIVSPATYLWERIKQWDDGIAAQTIMLSAVEKGFGGCMIGSCRREDIARALGIDTDAYSIDLVLALGKPKER